MANLRDARPASTSSEPQVVPLREPSLVPNLPKLVAERRGILNDMGPDARERFWDYIEALRSDRAAAARLLEEALAELPEEEVFGPQGAEIVFVLGHVGHRSSVRALTDILAQASTYGTHSPEGEHVVSGDPASVTGSLVAEALDRIATRYHTADVVLPVVDALEETLAHPDAPRSIKVAAARVLLAHAENPASRDAELALLMGEDADLLELRLVGSVSEVRP